MKHITSLSRLRGEPAKAADIEDAVKILNEALSLASALVDTLNSWHELSESKSE